MRARFFNTFEPVSPIYRDLLPYLAQQGVEVEVVISDMEYRSSRRRLEEVLDGPNIKLIRIWTGQTGATDRLRKLWAMIAYPAGAAMYSLLWKPAALNVFLTQPPLFALWGCVLHLLRKQRFVYLLMDIYPDVAIQAGLLGESSLLARILSALARFVLGKANLVIVIGRCMAEQISNKGVPAERIHLIPNWVNEKQVFRVSRPDNSLRHELGLQDDFVVLYSGNLGVSHSFEDVLEVARRCQGRRDIRFVFVGDGVRRKEVEQAQMHDQLDNVLLLPYQPFERLAESMSLGDVHFVTLRERFEGLVVPSKAYGALAVGRPIIYQGSATGEVARMVIEEQVGVVVSQGDPDGLERAVLHYYENPDLVAAEGDRALSLAENEYSSRHALQRYASLLLHQDEMQYG